MSEQRYKDDGDFDVNFGALPPLPPGYRVVWCDGLEHYLATGPDPVNGPGEWDSPVTWNRFQARRFAFNHHAWMLATARGGSRV